MKSLGLKFNKKKNTYLDYDKFPAPTKRQQRNSTCEY